jgi:hypothetical protein
MSTDTSNTATSASDIVFPTKVVALVVLKTPAGEPVRVKIRKLDIAEVAAVRAQFPAIFRKPTEDEKRTAGRPRTPEQEAKAAADFKGSANALIIAAAEEPRFCLGKVPKDGAAPIEAIYDDDRSVLFEAIMRLSDMFEGDASSEEPGNGGAAADGLATFPDQHAAGSEPG